MNKFISICFILIMLTIVGCGTTPNATVPPSIEATSPSVLQTPIPTIAPKDDAAATPLLATAEINENNKPTPQKLMTMTPTTSDFSSLLNLPQVEQAQNDLASRLSITTAEITIIDIQLKTWSDSSMGCPQPGMEYLQVLQDGLLIQLQVDNKIYDYHSGGRRAPFLCETNP